MLLKLLKILFSKENKKVKLSFFFLYILVIPMIHGHVPIKSGNNENIEGSTVIDNPTKSWAVYSELEREGIVQYFKFEINKGEEIYFSLLKSTRPEDKDFLPSAILMGQNIVSSGQVPEYIEIPSEYSAILIEGKQPREATYEAFGPGSYFSLGELNLNTPESGVYYIAVFEPSRSGHYSLAIGRTETFSLDEWILNPINIIDVYQWGGQNITIIFAPLIISVTIGLIIILFKKDVLGVKLNYFRFLGIFAGLVYIGTGVSLIFQMIFNILRSTAGVEIILTILFALAPILIGVQVTRQFLKNYELNNQKRIYLIIYGLFGIFTWAGIIIAPIITIILSFLPKRSTV
jgi:hypothetical protein